MAHWCRLTGGSGRSSSKTRREDAEKAAKTKNGKKKGLNRKAAKEFVTKLCRYPKTNPTKSADIKLKLETELAIAEAEVEKLEARRKELTRAIANPALYQDQSDSANLVILQKELGEVKKDLSAAEDRWAKAQENWDAAHA